MHEPAGPERFKQRTVRAIGWSWIGQTGRQGVTLVVTLGLARLITPEHFGLMAMVLVFSEFAVLLTEAGFGSALVQRKEIEREHLDAVFWASLSIGLVLSVVTWLAAPALAAFYGEPAVAPLAIAMSPVFTLGAVAVVPHAMLRRDLAFEKLARIELGAALVAGCAAVAGALFGLQIGALVLLQLVAAAGSAIGCWAASGIRPGRSFRLQKLRELSAFGNPMLGFQSMNYWARTADNLLIGRFVGAAALGFYGHAYRIMLIPVRQVTLSLQRVMFPALSRIQDQPERIGAIWLRANGVIALTTMPIVVGLFVLADPFVAAALGPQWMPVVPLLQVLCFAAIKQPMGSTTGWIYQARGRADLQLRWGFVACTITILGFVCGLPWGAVGVAASYSITRYLTWYHGIAIPGRLVGVTFGQFVGRAAAPFGCSVAMGVVLWLVGMALPARGPFVDLAVRVPLGVLVYLVSIQALGLEAWRDLRNTVRPRRAASVASNTAVATPPA